MPIRGHSGVQGGAEMGAYATAFPGGDPVDAEHAARVGASGGASTCPGDAGLTAPEMVEAAERGELDVLFVDGSNLLEVLPDPPRVEAALGRVPLRVHQDIVLTSQMFVDGDDVILLPAATRYEQEGGGTSTTTERQIAFSPQVAEPLGEARSEWRIFAELASRVRPDLADRFAWPDNRALRAEIADARPAVRRHRGPRRDRRRRAVRRAPPVRRRRVPDARRAGPVLRRRRRRRPRSAPTSGSCRTRRGKQFNSMVLADDRPADRRRPRRRVHRPPRRRRARRRRRRPVHADQRRPARSTGRAKLVRLPSRTLQVHWPEGNVLLRAGPVAARAAQPHPRLQRRRHVRVGTGCATSDGDRGRTRVRPPSPAAGRRRARRRRRAAVRRRRARLPRRGRRHRHGARRSPRRSSSALAVGLAARRRNLRTRPWSVRAGVDVWLGTVIDRHAAAPARVGPRHGAVVRDRDDDRARRRSFVGWRAIWSITRSPPRDTLARPPSKAGR